MCPSFLNNVTSCSFASNLIPSVIISDSSVRKPSISSYILSTGIAGLSSIDSDQPRRVANIAFRTRAYTSFSLVLSADMTIGFFILHHQSCNDFSAPAISPRQHWLPHTPVGGEFRHLHRTLTWSVSDRPLGWRLHVPAPLSESCNSSTGICVRNFSNFQPPAIPTSGRRRSLWLPEFRGQPRTLASR